MWGSEMPFIVNLLQSTSSRTKDPSLRTGEIEDNLRADDCSRDISKIGRGLMGFKPMTCIHPGRAIVDRKSIFVAWGSTASPLEPQQLSWTETSAFKSLRDTVGTHLSNFNTIYGEISLPMGLLSIMHREEGQRPQGMLARFLHPGDV